MIAASAIIFLWVAVLAASGAFYFVATSDPLEDTSKPVFLCWLVYVLSVVTSIVFSIFFFCGTP